MLLLILQVELVEATVSLLFNATQFVQSLLCHLLGEMLIDAKSDQLVFVQRTIGEGLKAQELLLQRLQISLLQFEVAEHLTHVVCCF